MGVKITNGTRIQSESKCYKFEFGIQRYQFQAQDCMIQLGGYDLIFDVEWSRELGLILCDFFYITIKFKIH